MEARHDLAVAFLERFRPGGPWVLVAIACDQKRIETRTFRDPVLVLEWLKAHSADNIYFHVNPTISDLDRKAAREDVRELAWLHVDVDPKGGEKDLEREQALAGSRLSSPRGSVPPPTLIIFSGGGFQGFWKLREPFPINGDVGAAEEAKRYNLQLELVFDADNCHNVDRIMRLPGTMNWPTVKKSKKGRKPVLAAVCEWEDDRLYDLAQFTKAATTQPAPGQGIADVPAAIAAPGNIKRLSTVEELKAWEVPDWCCILIVQGRDIDNPTKYPSRSETLFAVVCELVRRSVPDDVIYSVITDPDFLISESVLEKKSSVERYALRQIGRAKEEAIDPALRRMNERYCVIRNYGGKCRVIEEVVEPKTKRARLTHLSFDDIGNAYCNEKVENGQDKDGKPAYAKLGTWWLHHLKRRTLDQVIFIPGEAEERNPGCLNLWKGFDCDALPGDCGLLLAHMLENICGGNAEYFTWLLNWMGNAVQRPAEQGHVAIVFRGKQGAGKGVAARAFGSLWGRHFLPVADPKHLVGSFNAHLRDCCVLFADEAFFAGDKKHVSVLKTLITEETIPIEAKGVDVVESRNYLHLLMASNDDWVVPAGFDERRFFVLDVADSHAQDISYFRAIQDQLAAGGREGLLHLLLTRDLAGFNVRNPPRTAALQEQKELSLGAEEEWWAAKLRSGRSLPSHGEWRPQVLLEEFLLDYISQARQFAHPGRKGNLARLEHFLKRITGDRLQQMAGTEPVEAVDRTGERRVLHNPIYVVLPPLDECRSRWDALFGTVSLWCSPPAAAVNEAKIPF